MRLINLFFKRLIDLIGSIVGLIVLLPIFIIISIAIKIDSKGPVFFKQERLGKKGKVFKIFKFRTMIVGAEKIGSGLTIKSDSDTRITRIGKILRKTSLDEIPQLINILIGNMSFVGPRPPVTYFPYKGFENYPEWMKLRFKMKPGVTGLAQVVYRNSANWDQRIFLDIKYIEKFNIFLDFKLLVQTFLKLLKKETIYGQSERKNWTQPPLKYEQGYLNKIENSDFKYYYKWRNDEEVFYYLGGGYKKTSKNKMLEIFNAMLLDKENVRYTIINNMFVPIGMIGLYSIDENNRTAEVGMYIGNKKERQKGHAKGSYLAFEQEVKENFNIDKIKLFVVKENAKAVKFWEKVGYSQIAIDDKKRKIYDKEYNVIIMHKSI